MSRTSDTASALRRVLDNPIYNRVLKKEVGRGELDYEVYLRTRELLSLQTPTDELVVPDELLFQILHQTQELWLKCTAFETTQLVESLEDETLFHALAALDRIVQITRSLSEQIRLMFTLSPSRFHVIRRSLGNGSGLESPGYNQMHAAAEAAWHALEGLMTRRGTTLLAVYRSHDDHPDLHRIAESFVDWDAAMQAWLVEHFMLVRRTLGVDKTVRALDGFPTVALSARMTRPLFPALWNVRAEMSRDWSRDGGYAPGETRGRQGLCPFSGGAIATPPAEGTEDEEEEEGGFLAEAATTPVAATDGSSLGTAPTPSAASYLASATMPPASMLREAALRERELREHAPRNVALLETPGTTDYRLLFPLLNDCVYLNSNATGATPRSAKLVLDEYWRTIERWRDEAWQSWLHDLRDHADGSAALIGAPAGSVVCDTSLATLLGRVLSCFNFRARPGIVTTDLEFPSVPFILRAHVSHGAALTVVHAADGIAIDANDVAQAIDERTQLVCVSHATFATGSLVNLSPIVRRAREVGALVALDVYQSVGAVPIDVGALDVDFVLGGAHKWLCGSYESAFLYVRPSLLPLLEPTATGWFASADPLSFETPTRWADDARRFASGTPAVLPSLLSRPGLDIVREIGIDRIRVLSLARTDRVIARADEAGIPVATPRAHERRGGIVALRFSGDAEVARTLVASGFVCSYRGGIRIAPHFYNTDEEIDGFMDALVPLARAAS